MVAVVATNMLRRFAKAISDVDEKVQRGMRSGIDKLPGEPNVKAAYNHFMHPLRDSLVHPDDGPYDKQIAIGGSRAAQAGMITAAGLGLMKLTEQFGGAADQQEPGQLSLSDEDQETYNKIKALQAGLLVSGSAALGYGMARGDGNDDLRTRRK